ncbi:MAG: SiaB family protein kinase [Crocinitomicaceae bacterium]|nr:hypothetical protein [Crocinitomicaceae bacterium]
MIKFRKFLRNDSISLFYHGIFDDEFTDKFISLVAVDNKRRVQGRMAFVLAESFQNIIRHKDEEIDTNNSNSFGVRVSEQWMHIFSSNLVGSEVKEVLNTNLKNINAFDKDELKAAYLQILHKAQLSEKGGAGLGLIEMARKSNNPIQFEFLPETKDVFAFNMQVDFEKVETNEITEPIIPIHENSELNDLILKEDILFVYNGEFGDDVLQPIIPVLETNASVLGISGYSVFHIAVELMQNIGRHAVKNDHDQRSGLFIIKKSTNGYYICSGNYADVDAIKLKEQVKELNDKSIDELNALYKIALKESLSTNVNNAGVGLIDIRRTSGNPISLEYLESEKGTYIMLGVNITI